MKNIIKKTVFLIAMAIAVVGCESSTKMDDDGKEEPQIEICDEEEDDKDNDASFCSCVSAGEIDKTIPIVNEFLSALPETLSGEQKLQALEEWLNTHSCISDAFIEHYSAIKTNPPTSEIHISFYKGQSYTMDVLWTNPMTVTRFHNVYYKHEDTEEPVEVSSMEYSLEETSCQWTSLNRNSIGRSFILINSNNELGNYITCEEGCDYPAIDFTKHTLLLAYGYESGLYFQGPVYLHQFSTGYVLNADFVATVAAVIQTWQSAIIVDKLPEDINIELLVNFLNLE